MVETETMQKDQKWEKLLPENLRWPSLPQTIRERPNPQDIIKEIEAGVEPQNFSKYTSIPDRREAIKMAR